MKLAVVSLTLLESVRGLVAPVAPVRPRSELQAIDPLSVGLGLVAVGGGAVLASQDNRDIDDKTEVEKYFNGDTGFGRWNKIYSESDDVNDVQTVSYTHLTLPTIYSV